MMDKDDFVFYVYNNKTWKQDIDINVLTYTNYIRVKMSSLEDITYKNKHLLMQIQNIRGKTD